MSRGHHDEHVDCSQALYRMSEYLDGEMTVDDARVIAQHLTSCAPCLAEHDVDQLLKQLVHRSCAASEPAPAQLRTTIMQSITTICDNGSWTEVTQVRRISTEG